MIAALLIAPFAYGIGHHVFVALIPQSMTVDCNGSAEAITLTMRGPIFQLIPICYLAIILWLLHLRAFALSPRRK